MCSGTLWRRSSTSREKKKKPQQVVRMGNTFCRNIPTVSLNHVVKCIMVWGDQGRTFLILKEMFDAKTRQLFTPRTPYLRWSMVVAAACYGDWGSSQDRSWLTPNTKLFWHQIWILCPLGLIYLNLLRWHIHTRSPEEGACKIQQNKMEYFLNNSFCKRNLKYID